MTKIYYKGLEIEEIQKKVDIHSTRKEDMTKPLYKRRVVSAPDNRIKQTHNRTARNGRVKIYTPEEIKEYERQQRISESCD